MLPSVLRACKVFQEWYKLRLQESYRERRTHLERKPTLNLISVLPPPLLPMLPTAKPFRKPTSKALIEVTDDRG